MYSGSNIVRRAAMLIIAIAFLLSDITMLPADVLRSRFLYSNAAASSDENYRCYLEYTLDNGASSDKTAGILRQTVMYLYALKDEVICLGSDIYDSCISASEKRETSPTGADIVLVCPDSTVVTFDTILNGKGYIGNTAQENNLPDFNGTGDPNKYDPHMFTVPEEGIYEVRFHSYTGNRSISHARGNHYTTSINPVNVKKSSDAWQNSSTTVGAWDITVIDPQETDPDNVVKRGRAYTKCLCLNIGSNGVDIHENYHVVTSDGYIYRTEFDQMDPFGFIFFSNNRGLIDEKTNNSAYHSYQTAMGDLSTLQTVQNITFQNPNNKDSDIDKTFRIFFEEPDPALVGKLYPKAYVPDQITDVEFIGSKLDNVSYVDDGGYFKFTVNNSTSATVRISFDEYNRINNTSYTPVTITQNAFSGDNYFYWDGRDSSGTIIPEGVYESGIQVSVTNHAGEYHFPLFDVENSSGRIYVERINKIYERCVDANGNIYDKDVTNDFESQKHNVFYNNSLSPDNIKMTRDQLITDEAAIEYIQKYSVKIGPHSSDAYNATGDDALTFGGGIVANQSYHVRVFNREKTMAELGLTGAEADALYERLKNGEDLNAWFDYYLVIADQENHSEGVNTQEEMALHFPQTAAGHRTGDLTAIDIWTYSLGQSTETTLKQGIVIEDIYNYRRANINGKVFFDTNKNTKFSISEGDYGIANVLVTAEYTYTETRWEPEYDPSGTLLRLVCKQASDGNKYVLTPTAGGKFTLSINDVTKTDSSGVPLTFNVPRTELPHDPDAEIIPYRYYMDIPVHMETRTDANGTYRFTGILIPESPTALGNFDIRVTRPSEFYDLTTETAQSGSFTNLYGREYQSIKLSDVYAQCEGQTSTLTFSAADVGYFYEVYEPPIILKKEWETDVSYDPGRPEHITYRLVGTTSEEPDVFLYMDDIDLYYYKNSWQETLEHLPKHYNGKELVYRVLFEIFEKNGITYYFDGEQYTDSNGYPVTPPYYSYMVEDRTYTGHILTVVNKEFYKTIEVIKLADTERQNGVVDALFKVEQYDTATSSWVLFLEETATDRHGVISLRDIPPGRYRFTEIEAPDGYLPIEPFEVELTDETPVCRKTIYEPPDKVSLTLTKSFTVHENVPVSFPGQELEFVVEFAYDKNFTDMLPLSFHETLIPNATQGTYTILDNVKIPNLSYDKEIYVRIKELNAGSYEVQTPVVTASGIRAGAYNYGSGDITFDKNNKTLIFKLKHSTEGTYSTYNVSLENDAKYADTMRFEKIWFDANMNKISARSGLRGVYAMLMRRNLLTGEVEQVKYTMGGEKNTNAKDENKYASLGSKFGGSVKDADLAAQGYFYLNWKKNFTKESWWFFPKYAPDGGKYMYFIQEVTNERGNPLCITASDTPQYLYDYKVIPQEEYTETFTVKSSGEVETVVVVRNGKTLLNQKPADKIYNKDQDNYFLLNRYAPDIALRVTKNQYNDTDDPLEGVTPLKGAEFTLYSDSECKNALDKVVTGADGIGNFSAPLESGKTYYLKETKAPTGYVIDGKALKLEYVGDKSITITEKNSDGTESQFTKKADDQYVVNITRTNVLNITLPQTGAGTTAVNLSVIGILLMGIAAAVILLMYKRMPASTEGR